MEQIIGIYVLLAIILSFVNLKYGIAVYISYLILVPYLNIQLGISLSYNFVNLLMLLSFLTNSIINKKRIDIKAIKPFLIYFVFFLFLIPIQWNTPYDYQFNAFRQDFMTIIFVPLIIWNIIRKDRTAIKLFESTLLISILIAGLYGLFLTIMPGVNPYIMMIMDMTGGEFNEKYFLADGEGRLFGRISSVFLHPMTFGLFIGLSVIYIYSLWSRWNRYILSIILVVLLINMITCGVRSVIGGLFFAFIYYVVKGHHYKLAIWFTLAGGLALLVIGTNSELGVYLGSIVRKDSSEVTGSSIEMRLSQFGGAIKEISSCFFQGNGYGWTEYYKSIKGDHPTLFAFESLVFVVVCNGGLIGIVIWITFVAKIIKFLKKYFKRSSDVVIALLVFYISYACITGEYNYMRYFVLFYVIMLGGAMQNKFYIQVISNEKNVYKKSNNLLKRH